LSRKKGSSAKKISRISVFPLTTEPDITIMTIISLTDKPPGPGSLREAGLLLQGSNNDEKQSDSGLVPGTRRQDGCD